MAISDPMKWDPKGKRWRRTLNGKYYEVYCHQLGLPKHQYTQEASRNAMRGWWERKFAEITNKDKHEHPNADTLQELESKLDYAKRTGLQDEIKALKTEIQRVEVLPQIGDEIPPEFDNEIRSKLELANQQGVTFPDDMDPMTLKVLFSSSDTVHRDRVARERKVETERTIGVLIEKWLENLREEAKSGIRSTANVDTSKHAVNVFKEFIGKSSPVEAVTFDLWHKFHLHCSEMVEKRDENEKEGWSPDTARKYFVTVRLFLNWLADRDILQPPKNLNSRKYIFERPDKEIPQFTDEEIKQLLDAANGMHKLILLIMLNTGATQKDLSDLKIAEIDLEEGRITRRRSKTRKLKKSRLISYKLWTCTLDLLKEHIAKTGVYALLTQSGQRWVWTKFDEKGQMVKSDNVATVFNNLKKKIKMVGAGKSVKVFRKTSATRIKDNDDFKELRFMFLGHSEQTVADKHYAKSLQLKFDKAVTWLGKQYGF